MERLKKDGCLKKKEKIKEIKRKVKGESKEENFKEKKEIS